MNEDKEFEEVRFDELYFSDLEDEDPNGDVSYYFRDPIVKQVVDQFVSMDAILYIQAAKEDLACTPQCKCQVKDVEPRAKTTIGDLSALHDLKAKMLVKKFNDKQHAANKEAQAIWDKDNFGHINSFYGNDYASNNT